MTDDAARAASLERTMRAMRLISRLPLPVEVVAVVIAAKAVVSGAAGVRELREAIEQMELAEANKWG